MKQWLSQLISRGDDKAGETSTAEVLRARDGINRAGAQLTSAVQEAAAYKREAKLRQIINIAIARYFIKGDRSAAASIAFEDVRIDSNPDWVPEMLARPGVSEPEFNIFKHFAQDDGTILDIGANYGYAAASMWSAGATSRILSFEPNPWHFPCLSRIKELRAGRYDFLPFGLGAEASQTRFVIPVIEGIGISALASAAIEAETDWTIPENVLFHMQNDHPDVEMPNLRFTEVIWHTERLDDVLRTARPGVDLSAISAMKIDVEGFEESVLAGAGQTLRDHRPLIMIEGANRSTPVVALLTAAGYRYAEFADDRLVLSADLSSRANGFFLHADRVVEYAELGLLVS